MVSVTLSVHGPFPARGLALNECRALGARTFLPRRGDRPTRLGFYSSPSSADHKLNTGTSPPLNRKEDVLIPFENSVAAPLPGCQHPGCLEVTRGELP